MDRTSRWMACILCGLLWVPRAGLAGTGGGTSPTARPGLLVMAHGGDPVWNRAVNSAVEELRPAFPVALALGMAQPEPLQKAVDELEQEGVTHIAVVRLFVSPESFREQIEYLLGVRRDPPTVFIRHHMGAHGSLPMSHDQIQVIPGSMAPPPIRVRAAIGLNRQGLYDSENIGRILVDRVLALSTSPEQETVLVLAHGEGDDALNDRWQERLDRLAALIRTTRPFREVRVETLREDWYPEREAAERRIRAFVRDRSERRGRVLVVPFRVFGFGPYAQVLEGLEFISDGKGLLPHQAVTEWIREEARECFNRLGVPGPGHPSPEPGTPPPPSPFN